MPANLLVERGVTLVDAASPQGDSASVHSALDRLHREFEAPVGWLEPASRRWVACVGAPRESFPDPDACSRGLTASGTAPLRDVTLWSPHGPDGVTWLALPVVSDAGTEAWALVGFAGPAREPALRGPWGAPCPRRALRLWGHAVVADLRASSEATATARLTSSSRAREAPLLDRLIRWLRVSDAPERFQRLAITELREELAVECIAWVSAQPREPVQASSDRVRVEVFRALVAEAPTLPIQVLYRPPSAPEIDQAVIVAADPEHPAGWLIAVNPVNGRTPSKGQMELLQLVALLIGTQRSNARLYADLKDLLFGVIRALTSAIDAKDPYTCGHSERVARIAVRLAEQLGVSANQRGDLYLMGLLHDVGKIGVDDQVLKKPGKLTPEEYRLIQAHVRIGVHILSDLKKLSHLIPGVAHHHEAFDGSGYPTGLVGEEIPMPARILAVADAYDAMSSTRPYRRRLSPSQIDDIFRDGSAKQWDPKVVEALFACRADIEQIRQKGLGESLNRVVNDQLGRA